MMLDPPETSEFQRWADPIGGTGAMLCALHCAALPFVLIALPTLTLGFFSSAGFEQAFVAFATVIGIASLTAGYRRHRNPRALQLLACGLSAVWIGVMAAPVHDNLVAHALTMSIGGTLIALAHIVNLRLSRQHIHTATCTHGH